MDCDATLRGAARIVPESAVQVVALTVSATIATMPIAWLNFGRISLVGPLANVFVEPVFVVAFWLSALTAVLARSGSRQAGSRAWLLTIH